MNFKGNGRVRFSSWMAIFLKVITLARLWEGWSYPWCTQCTNHHFLTTIVIGVGQFLRLLLTVAFLSHFPRNARTNEKKNHDSESYRRHASGTLRACDDCNDAEGRMFRSIHVFFLLFFICTRINATVVVVRNDRFDRFVTSFIIADLYYESSSF
jgi:hypothetical protein